MDEVSITTEGATEDAVQSIGEITDPFLLWCIQREPLLQSHPLPSWVIQDAIDKSHILLDGISPWLDETMYKLLYYNARLHYIITTAYTDNPLYKKFNIGDKRSGIVSSASDESSSASYHIIKSLNEADFTTQDLMMTSYGLYVYQILERLDIYPTLL